MIAPAALLLFVTVCATAQLRMPIASVESRRAGNVTFTGVSTLAADRGAPFSGEQKVTMELTSAGSKTMISEPGSGEKWWRDAQGRTRMEQPGSPIVQMCDPVEGACYVLDPREMIAHRMKYEPREVTTVNPADIRDEKKRLEGMGIVVESFGERTIQGVNAKGYRFKVALIHESTEVWFAPALGMTIRSVTTEGPVETITEIVNLRLENPAPELFKIPAGYTVRDEVGPFTIALDTPR